MLGRNSGPENNGYDEEVKGKIEINLMHVLNICEGMKIKIKDPM